MRFRLPLALCALAVAVPVAPAMAQQPDGATFFEAGEQPAFASAAAARGLAVDAAEDFEDARPQRGLLGLPILSGPPTGVMDDPLDARGGGSFFAPGQIPASLRVQSNRQNQGTTGTDPVGRFGLAISRPSSQGSHGSSTTISSPYQESGPVSTDIIAVDAAHQAYALDVSLVRFSFVEPGTDPVGGPLEISVFDEAGASLGSTQVTADEIGPFVGVIAPPGREIGRINLSEPGGSELIHGIVAYDADGGADTGSPAPASNPLNDILQALGLGPI